MLRTEQALVEFKQSRVDVEQVIVLLPDEVHDDHVEFAAVCQSVTRPTDQIPGLIQIQLQRQRQSNSGGLGGLIVGIVADFGKMLPGEIGFGVDFRILFPGLVNELQQGFGESRVGLRQQVDKAGFRRSRHGHWCRCAHLDIFQPLPANAHTGFDESRVGALFCFQRF